MDAPTAAEVREWAPPQFAFASYGYPAPEGEAPDTLEARTRWAWAYVLETTGRTPEDLTGNDQALAEQAVTLRVMQLALGSSATTFATLSKPWIKSFTAGSYSETRFSPSELGGNAKDVLTKVNPWLELASLLWLLMTDEKRDYWLEVFGGRVRPAGAFIPVDFSGEAAWSGEPYDETGVIE
jgi:hypothetical protein